MTKRTHIAEPTNIERAGWARKALAVFTSETYGGNEPCTMHPEDLESAIGDLICDLMHFAYFHPRLDAVAIHTRARSTFESELAEARKGDVFAEPVAHFLDALLNVKRLAGKSGDGGADPFALLDLIADEVQTALAAVTLK